MGHTHEPEALQELKKQHVFHELTDDELAPLLAKLETRTLLTGEALWTPGDTREAAFILRSGRIERTLVVGAREATFFEKHGDILALSALVKDWIYHSSATAVENTEVFVLTRAAFEELLASEERAAFKIVDLIATYLVIDIQSSTERLQEVFGHPAETLRMLRRRVREDSKV